MKRKRTILAVCLGIAALLLTVALVSGRMFTEKRLKTAETMAGLALQPIETAQPKDISTDALDTKTAPEQKNPEIYAVFGVDTEEGDAGRSDCILLLSQSENRVKMCSLARDTLVLLPEEGVEDKLCHAYAYGGPREALETINQSFDLNISRYVTVNFSQMESLVELLGGAEVTLTREEWQAMELPEPYLGRRTLSGAEALRYCRIRAIDSDDMRTARQRNVVTALLRSLRQTSIRKLPELCGLGIGMCRTNISLGELIQLGKNVVSGSPQVESLAIPGDSVAAWGGVREDGIWYYVYDLDRAAEEIHGFFDLKE